MDKHISEESQQFENFDSSGPDVNQDRFALLAAALQREMLEDHVAVDLERNPVVKIAGELTVSQAELIVSNYCRFPEQIVGFLTSASEIADQEGWASIGNELRRNIGEELGSDSGGHSHYELLKKGAREELELDILAEPVSAATTAFVGGMVQHTGAEVSPAFVMGAIYACECSAVPELIIVKELVNTLSTMKHGQPLAVDGALSHFLAMHLDQWEPGHEEGLHTTCAEHIDTEELQGEFRRGFRAVMNTMDQWWRSLAAESISPKIN